MKNHAEGEIVNTLTISRSYIFSNQIEIGNKRYD